MTHPTRARTRDRSHLPQRPRPKSRNHLRFQCSSRDRSRLPQCLRFTKSRNRSCLLQCPRSELAMMTKEVTAVGLLIPGTSIRACHSFDAVLSLRTCRSSSCMFFSWGSGTRDWAQPIDCFPSLVRCLSALYDYIARFCTRKRTRLDTLLA